MKALSSVGQKIYKEKYFAMIEFLLKLDIKKYNKLFGMNYALFYYTFILFKTTISNLPKNGVMCRNRACTLPRRSIQRFCYIDIAGTLRVVRKKYPILCIPIRKATFKVQSKIIELIFFCDVLLDKTRNWLFLLDITRSVLEIFISS